MGSVVLYKDNTADQRYIDFLKIAKVKYTKKYFNSTIITT